MTFPMSGEGSLNRIPPALEPQHMKTYQIVAPTRTHWRSATCLEVNCQHYIHGWATTVAVGGRDEAIIRTSGRRFIERKQPGGFIQFMFYPEQPCFRATAHRVPLEREPFYLVHPQGDHRTIRPGSPHRRHTRAGLWVEDFAEHQDGIAKVIERG